MSVIAPPFIENLRLIRDTVTGRSVVCTAKQIDAPMQWRTGIVDAYGADGGYDTVIGRNYMKYRTIQCTLIKRFNQTAGESFATACADLESVITPGNILELSMVDDTGRTWFWYARMSEYTKSHSLKWVGYCEFPITFIAADPHQRSQYKPGILVLDDGWFLDETPNPYLLDVDPDAYLLTAGTITAHTITNDGTVPDYAPTVALQGPINGIIYVTYSYADGSYVQWQYLASIAASETVTVNAAQREVVSSVASVDAYHNFYPPIGLYNTTSVKGSWGFIDVGATLIQIQYTSVGAGANAAIAWWPRK